MKCRMRRGGAVVLAAALMFSAFVLPNTYAAQQVQVTTKCTVEIKKPVQASEELKTTAVTVNLYKVATIDAQGDYSEVAGFESLDIANINLSDPAANWEAKAIEAKAIVDAASGLEKKTLEVSGMSAVISDVDTGLYLVDPQPTKSATEEYNFDAYLVSLPNNYYNGTSNTDDSWIYNLTGDNALKLKPQITDRVGTLRIEKSLDVYNETIGGATFVFQVEAVKGGESVYSNVFSTTFHAPGKDVITVKGIPAGATVTVTEIYSGASYELTSEANKTATIVADEDALEPAKVTFSNTYNEKLNGGSGIVNSFTYSDGEWSHSASEDSTGEE